MLSDLSKKILSFTRADGVVWWLKEDHGFFYADATVRIDGSIDWVFEALRNEQLVAGPLPKETGLVQALNESIIADTVGTGPWTLTANDTLYIPDTSLLTKSAEESDSFSMRISDLAGNVRCILLVSLKYRTDYLGTMTLWGKQANQLAEEMIGFMETVAPNFAMALESRGVEAKLRERLKELTCLYDVLHIAEKPGKGIDEVLQGIVERIPVAWQYPETACARIVFDGKEYVTGRYETTDLRQSTTIQVSDKRRGFIEVIYRSPRPEADEGPFLREERALIEALAREISFIVERRQAREERTRLEEQIRHADRLATIGQLSAGVAHEINEPLGSILGFAQLLKREGRSEEIRDDLQKIIDASLRARETVRKLKFFARQMPPRREKTDLNAVFTEALFFFRMRCQNRGITIEQEFDDALPDITVDPGQIHQLIVNLVVNAFQAMPEGGTLSVRTKKLQDSVMLSVKDTGVGMTEEVEQKIFAPFFTTKEVDEGTGLGLSVVDSIVKSHGGVIEVDSKPGSGTVFTVHLPMRTDASSQDVENQ
jgi:signal transduction histidine kinase